MITSRLLYARIGIPHCPICGRRSASSTLTRSWTRSWPCRRDADSGTSALSLRGRKGEHVKEFEKCLAKSGMSGHGGRHSLICPKDPPEKNKKHTIEDHRGPAGDPRGYPRPSGRFHRNSYRFPAGCSPSMVEQEGDGRDMTFPRTIPVRALASASMSSRPDVFPSITLMAPVPKCTGLGSYMSIDPDLIIANRNLSIREGAIRASGWSYIDGGTIAQM